MVAQHLSANGPTINQNLNIKFINRQADFNHIFTQPSHLFITFFCFSFFFFLFLIVIIMNLVSFFFSILEQLKKYRFNAPIDIKLLN